eukprot:CAMPEP_0203840996 /NCGR_PEP_ID=MMETSP0359-20131031/1110_1 /ASSEMBLY_ACC=CAM_ASM_000338 /TAXON_ID=268821 /ORGANISM="Scrippsiella Hangoei, Strain SHTV-5" /LENGTH=635 /DNA_ID=CAMNT_0050755301 /DNA_START=61 /DNA_END=1969 /DNA_ORIENTATION=+
MALAAPGVHSAAFGVGAAAGSSLGAVGGERPRALQLVRLNERMVEINEAEFAIMERKLQEVGAEQVAVVTVMGSFRTGKSFLLDLFLRYLRHEDAFGGAAAPSPPPPRPAPPPRGSGEAYPLPAWWTAAAEGAKIAGAGQAAGEDGFRFRGGADPCTEGIWAWSEPFVRVLGGRRVALLLLDTQGAWGGDMTREQSATIFGLTALISSRQIYNINMQIEETKVDNMAYMMSIAQQALRKAAENRGGAENLRAEVTRPFQCLDFLVRDWRNFEDEWLMARCREQMNEQLDRFLGPNARTEGSTAEALDSMYGRIGAFFMPHPGRAVEKTTWDGNIANVEEDFVRFVDEYVREVFTDQLAVKTILGGELSPTTFPMVFRQFVTAFRSTAPAAMPFLEAIKTATILTARERALKSYSGKMDDELYGTPQGLDPETLEQMHTRLVQEIREDFDNNVVILGSANDRGNAWRAVEENLQTIWQRYKADNICRLEKALIALVDVSLLGFGFFAVDKASDFACDWWSQTCADFSKILFLAYLMILLYVAYKVYLLYNDRGRLSTVTAVLELGKEVLSRSALLGNELCNLRLQDAPAFGRRFLKHFVGRAPPAPAGGGGGGSAAGGGVHAIQIDALAVGAAPRS